MRPLYDHLNKNFIQYLSIDESMDSYLTFFSDLLCNPNVMEIYDFSPNLIGNRLQLISWTKIILLPWEPFSQQVVQ